MLKNILRASFIVSIMITHLYGMQPRNTTLYVASLQFPSVIKELPDIRAYFAGSKITCEKDKELHRLLFTISTERSLRKMYLLVVENSFFETEENTVKYLKIKPSNQYKLWSLELMHKKNAEALESKVVGGIKLNADEKSPYFWIIHEENVDPITGQIPDNTLIVTYDPKLIDHLEGGSGVELPKMIIASNILDIVGSEEKLQDLSARYLLSALDSDAVHARSEYVITQHPSVNRITICTT